MNNTNIIIYQSEDGQTKIQTKLENETVWLSQEQMSELFQKSRSTINEHIKNIYRENELEESESMKKFGNPEFAKKPTNHYNSEDELNLLNRMVTAYIEIAEIQAMDQNPMYMKDWTERLDDFLKMIGKDILNHAGTISHDMAMKKANEEYLSYKEQTKNELSQVEKDFINQLNQATKKIEGR